MKQLESNNALDIMLLMVTEIRRKKILYMQVPIWELQDNL